jgi:hypothetical protein
MAHATDAHHDGHHDHAPGFVARWLFSTNHKDIGTLYLIFSIFASIIGVALSMLMRMELQQPGLQFFGSGQSWNTVVSAHSSFFWIHDHLRADLSCLCPAFYDGGRTPIRRFFVRGGGGLPFRPRPLFSSFSLDVDCYLPYSTACFP